MTALCIAVCRFPVIRRMQASTFFEEESSHPIKWDTLPVILGLGIILDNRALMRRGIISRFCQDGRYDLGYVAVDQVAESP